MALFLAFFKFELVSGDRKCVYSDWYVEDIADYWKSWRELVRIKDFDVDTPYDDLFSAEIRKAIKEIINGNRIEFQRVSFEGSQQKYRLKFTSMDQ